MSIKKYKPEQTHRSGDRQWEDHPASLSKGCGRSPSEPRYLRESEKSSPLRMAEWDPRARAHPEQINKARLGAFYLLCSYRVPKSFPSDTGGSIS